MGKSKKHKKKKHGRGRDGSDSDSSSASAGKRKEEKKKEKERDTERKEKPGIPGQPDTREKREQVLAGTPDTPKKQISIEKEFELLKKKLISKMNFMRLEGNLPSTSTATTATKKIQSTHGERLNVSTGDLGFDDAAAFLRTASKIGAKFRRSFRKKGRRSKTTSLPTAPIGEKPAEEPVWEEENISYYLQGMVTLSKYLKETFGVNLKTQDLEPKVQKLTEQGAVINDFIKDLKSENIYTDDEITHEYIIASKPKIMETLKDMHENLIDIYNSMENILTTGKTKKTAVKNLGKTGVKTRLKAIKEQINLINFCNDLISIDVKNYYKKHSDEVLRPRKHTLAPGRTVSVTPPPLEKVRTRTYRARTVEVIGQSQEVPYVNVLRNLAEVDAVIRKNIDGSKSLISILTEENKPGSKSLVEEIKIHSEIIKKFHIAKVNKNNETEIMVEAFFGDEKKNISSINPSIQFFATKLQSYVQGRLDVNPPDLNKDSATRELEQKKSDKKLNDTITTVSGCMDIINAKIAKPGAMSEKSILRELNTMIAKINIVNPKTRKSKESNLAKLLKESKNAIRGFSSTANNLDKSEEEIVASVKEKLIPHIEAFSNILLSYCEGKKDSYFSDKNHLEDASDFVKALSEHIEQNDIRCFETKITGETNGRANCTLLLTKKPEHNLTKKLRRKREVPLTPKQLEEQRTAKYAERPLPSRPSTERRRTISSGKKRSSTEGSAGQGARQRRATTGESSLDMGVLPDEEVVAMLVELVNKTLGAGGESADSNSEYAGSDISIEERMKMEEFILQKLGVTITFDEDKLNIHDESLRITKKMNEQLKKLRREAAEEAEKAKITPRKRSTRVPTTAWKPPVSKQGATLKVPGTTKGSQTTKKRSGGVSDTGARSESATSRKTTGSAIIETGASSAGTTTLSRRKTVRRRPAATKGAQSATTKQAKRWPTVERPRARGEIDKKSRTDAPTTPAESSSETKQKGGGKLKTAIRKMTVSERILMLGKEGGMDVKPPPVKKEKLKPGKRQATPPTSATAATAKSKTSAPAPKARPKKKLKAATTALTFADRMAQYDEATGGSGSATADTKAKAKTPQPRGRKKLGGDTGTPEPKTKPPTKKP